MHAGMAVPTNCVADNFATSDPLLGLASENDSLDAPVPYASS